MVEVCEGLPSPKCPCLKFHTYSSLYECERQMLFVCLLSTRVCCGAQEEVKVEVEGSGRGMGVCVAEVVVTDV